MNGAAWLAFGISASVAAFLVLWSLAIILGLLPESEIYKAAHRDGMALVVAFFLTGIAALLVGAPTS